MRRWQATELPSPRHRSPALLAPGGTAEGVAQDRVLLCKGDALRALRQSPDPGSTPPRELRAESRGDQSWVDTLQVSQHHLQPT